MSQNLKNTINENTMTDQDINNDLLKKIENNHPTKPKDTEKIYRIIPKLIQWLDSAQYKDDRFYSMAEIRVELSIKESPQEMRKLIQLYREHASDQRFIKPKRSAITGMEYHDVIQFYGMIIANSQGYKFSRDLNEIEKYLTKSMEPRRVSLSKQTLSAENVMFEIRKNKDAIKEYQKVYSGHELNKGIR